MTKIRESLYTKTRIGSIEFDAASASGGGKRRLAVHEAIGVDGASIEDLGEAPRVEQLSAHLAEDVYLQLENLRRDAKVQTCTHPLFGTFQGRIHELTYEAGSRHGVSVKITLIEDGQNTIQLAPVTLSLPASAAAFADGVDDWGGIGGGDPLDFGSATDAFDSFADSFDVFGGILDAVQAGANAWQSLGSALDDLGSSLDSMVQEVFDIADEIGQVGMDAVDIGYSIVRAARDCVDAAQSEAASILQPFQILEPASIADLCREFLGSDDDDAIDLFLEHNPSIIDINAMNAGLDIVIPI